MKINNTVRRVSYIFLCILPFLNIVVVGVRALRIPVVYQLIGGVIFAAVIIAAWILGARRVIESDVERSRRIALTGLLFIAPTAVVALLWVGLATPWDATPAENEVRYIVLLFNSISVTIAFVFLKELLSDASERFYSTLGFAANILSGAAYLIWTSFEVGAHAVQVRDGQIPPAIVALSDIFDILLFIACVLTYLATAAFAVSLGKIGWLGQGATRAYVIINLLALVLIMVRGFSFPDPTISSTPWYINLGFIVGIPAVPWIIPFLFGVVLLRRVGDENYNSELKNTIA
ncbi:MAG: hypothetical protein ACR2HG_13240 [Pyrinomonadaceae bacterium]